MACSSVSAREADRHSGGTQGEGALDRTLVVGTLIEAHMDPGGALTATVSADVANARRRVVIPAGSPVRLRMAHRTLEVVSVTVWGRRHAVRETAHVAPGKRILFVLSEGFTATIGDPSSQLTVRR